MADRRELLSHHERVLRGEVFKTEMDVVAYISHVLETYRDPIEVRDAMRVALAAYDKLLAPKTPGPIELVEPTEAERRDYGL